MLGAVQRQVKLYLQNDCLVIYQNGVGGLRRRYLRNRQYRNGGVWYRGSGD